MRDCEQADLLLLSYEVEAAAARNAELSRQLSAARDELSSRSRPLLDHAMSKATQTERDSSEDEKMALINLDDALFDIYDMLSALYPSAESTSMYVKRDLSLGRRPSLLAMSQTCLTEIKRLRCAWQTKERRYTKLLSDLQNTMHKHKAVAETEKTALDLTVQTAINDKLNLEIRCKALSDELNQLQSECSALRDERDALLQVQRKQNAERSLYATAEGQLRAENAQLRFDMTRLTRTLESLQKDWLCCRT